MVKRRGNHAAAWCRSGYVVAAIGNEISLRSITIFVTGTFGGLTPVREIDGHVLPRPLPGPVTARLRALYEALKDAARHISMQLGYRAPHRRTGGD